jgi:hypothetical protein
LLGIFGRRHPDVGDLSLVFLHPAVQPPPQTYLA